MWKKKLGLFILVVFSTSTLALSTLSDTPTILWTPEKVKERVKPACPVFRSYPISVGSLLDTLGNQYALLNHNSEYVAQTKPPLDMACIALAGMHSGLVFRTSPDNGITWFDDTLLKPLAPSANVCLSPSRPYAFYADLGAWFGIYGSGGYLSHIWDPGTNLSGVGDLSLHIKGKVFDEGNVLIGDFGTADTASWLIAFDDLSVVLNSGMTISPNSYFCDWDYNGGELVNLVLGGANGWDCSYIPPDTAKEFYLIGGLNTQLAVDNSGKPLFAFALLEKDAWGSGDINPDHWPGTGGIYLSKASGDTARRIDAEEGQPNYAFWPGIATGTIDGKPTIAILWLQTDGNTAQAQTKWDIYLRVSHDNGETWGEIMNLTRTPDISECLPQIARRLDVADSLAHIIYAEADDHTSDILYRTAFDEQFICYAYYLSQHLFKEIDIKETTATLTLTNNLAVVPNPFTRSTTIRYRLENPTRINLRIYDTSGRLVRTLAEKMELPGSRTMTWDGTNGNNTPLPNGVYILKGKIGRATFIRPLILIR